MAVEELARQVRKLDAAGKREIVRLVPALLHTEEVFLLDRRRQANEAVESGNLTDATAAIHRAKARRQGSV